MSLKAMVLLAPGFEDLEAVTVIDLLRRAKFQVSVISLHEDEVIGARGTRLITDGNLSLLDKQAVFDIIVLPGGQPGADNLSADPRVARLLKEQVQANRRVGALCAAPKVLAKAGLLAGKTVTHYPGALSGEEGKNVTISDAPVVVDTPLITGRSPGAAMDFALAIIEELGGPALKANVESALVR